MHISYGMLFNKKDLFQTMKKIRVQKEDKLNQKYDTNVFFKNRLKTTMENHDIDNILNHRLDQIRQQMKFGLSRRS